MKVLLLISTRGFFGAENAVLELAKQLLLSEFEPHIGIIENTSGLHRDLQEAAQKNNILFKIFSCSGKFDLRTISEIRNYTREKKIPLIHSQGYKSNIYALLSTINTKTKKMSTCHNWSENSVKMKLYMYLDKLLLNKFDKIIVVSEALKKELSDSKIPLRKISVISNGIEASRFDASVDVRQIRKSLSINEDEYVVGTVGRLTEEKGHKYLLKAVRTILKIYPKTKFLIVGEGPLRKRLEFLSKKLEIENNVIFTGIQKDIPSIIAAMDIFVLPSLDEGLPMALLEAMAARKPIIASNIGGIPKAVQNDQTGLLIRPADVEQLSEAILKLLGDKEKASFLAKNGYDKVKNEFSSKKMAEKYITEYKAQFANEKKLYKTVIVEISGRGGICHYTYNLSQELSKISNTTLITAKDYELKGQQRGFDLLEMFKRFKTNPFFPFFFIRAIRDATTIHFQLSQFPLFVLFLINLSRFFSRAAIIVTSHNVISHEYKENENSIYKKIYQKSDKIIVHSLYARGLLKTNFTISDSKIAIIPHGNYLFFNAGLSFSGRGGEVKKTVLFFGFIRKYKGLMCLIRAFAKVNKALPDSKLLIVGKPVEPFDEYRKEIERLHLDGNVEMNLEYVHFSKIKEYFERAGLVVLPYLEIAQSGILQLAYAFGKPVVVTNIGGLNEYVEDGNNGFIAPVNNADILAEKITAIMKDPVLQKKMGECSLELAHTKYSWGKVALDTIKTYEDAHA